MGQTLETFFLIVAIAAIPIAAQTRNRPVFLHEDSLPTIEPLLAEVTPAMVNILVEGR
ncbi:hypothetical protein [Albidovulum sp.]|uniref:hypothetical protein n=1 Tax=Albidovulum sp. TaxID=1872424 RepID=UPI0025BEC56D|nr:hypothetical protein [Defluviimonas sp.]